MYVHHAFCILKYVHIKSAIFKRCVGAAFFLQNAHNSLEFPYLHFRSTQMIYLSYNANLMRNMYVHTYVNVMYI